MMNESDQGVAKAALKLPSQLAGIVSEDEENELWHLLRSLLEYCDHRGLDFGRTLADVKADFV